VMRSAESKNDKWIQYVGIWLYNIIFNVSDCYTDFHKRITPNQIHIGIRHNNNNNCMILRPLCLLKLSRNGETHHRDALYFNSDGI